MATSFGPDLCRSCSAAYSVLNTQKSCPKCKADGCVKCIKYALPGANLRLCSACASASVEEIPAPATQKPRSADVGSTFILEQPPTSFPTPARPIFTSGASFNDPPVAPKKSSRANIFE